MDARFLGKPLRFATTHLETDADPGTQLSQANELVQALDCGLPVALCGDFNADANTTNPAIAAILGGGFTEAWPALYPLDPGFTIPLYTEDLPSPPPFTAVSTPAHRIDLVFVRDLRVRQINLIGNQVSPPWPSDHAGVISPSELNATREINKHCNLVCHLLNSFNKWRDSWLLPMLCLFC